MTSDEQKTELKKYSTLLLATLSYHLEHYTGSMVFDEWDPAAEHYLQEQQRTEKEFQEQQVDKLKARLRNHLTRPRQHIDLNFAQFIKNETGFDIDIFEDLRNEVAIIVSNEKIKSGEEFFKVQHLLKVYESTAEAPALIAQLKALIDDFTAANSLNQATAGLEHSVTKQVVVQVQAPPPNVGNATTLSIEETTEILTPEAFAEMNRRNGLLSEVRSPDGNRLVRVQTNGLGKNALTDVSISLRGGSGSIYCAKGARLPIKAYWGDNQTVVIETHQEYTYITKHHQVRSFDDVVKIEYLY